MPARILLFSSRPRAIAAAERPRRRRDSHRQRLSFWRRISSSTWDRQIPSGVAAILVATTPLWIGLFGMFWPHGERLTSRGWLGLVIGFVGIVLTLAPRSQDGFNLFGNLYVAAYPRLGRLSWASVRSSHASLP